ncbi:MAG TPA: GYD domain-containing protein [Methyloceanibacter sp.]|nr:GYD domain-containing protein [Methyloceanibacter sp.]
MPTYIVLGQFTDQGIRNVKDTSKRADAAKKRAKQFGAKVLDLYWTIGRYDTVFIVEAPDDETITAFALGSGMLGNVRTETLRAFSQGEITQILDRVE